MIIWNTKTATIERLLSTRAGLLFGIFLCLFVCKPSYRVGAGANGVEVWNPYDAGAAVNAKRTANAILFPDETMMMNIVIDLWTTVRSINQSYSIVIQWLSFQYKIWQRKILVFGYCSLFAFLPINTQLQKQIFQKLLAEDDNPRTARHIDGEGSRKYISYQSE